MREVYPPHEDETNHEYKYNLTINVAEHDAKMEENIHSKLLEVLNDLADSGYFNSYELEWQ